MHSRAELGLQVRERALSTNEPTGCPSPALHQTDRQTDRRLLQPGKGKPQNSACHTAAWRAEPLKVSASVSV